MGPRVGVLQAKTQHLESPLNMSTDTFALNVSLIELNAVIRDKGDLKPSLLDTHGSSFHGRVDAPLLRRIDLVS